MAEKTFKAKLTSEGEGGAWTILKIPFSVEKVWGTRARLAVKGTLNGFAFRNSVFPMGGGVHCLMVNKAVQAGAKAKAGDTVEVVMEPDAAPRAVAVPADLKKALAKNKAAKAAFEKMPYSHKKEYVEAIREAKKPETRARRIAGALKMMVAWGKSKE
ncbi:MAG TPA: YdeI/OmpD-associated family protein [Candidatus Xenobia bacterium]|nr:YdeI/OmpD-associated family protein [Candidatus Xenobia bacterium]